MTNFHPIHVKKVQQTLLLYAVCSMNKGVSKQIFPAVALWAIFTAIGNLKPLIIVLMILFYHFNNHSHICFIIVSDMPPCN